ncbi:hypothetical protein CYMTET_49714 [Cymbomonas tetramitiformis]|uniref:Uncharacterized protein n=1 Tax=Cymbomonas tetramitiformis TaxID=36881 RepID=A0AAE0BPJ7_9CHLO|nr:hypothetical protein CYMTET_49714 [Cymbomonas tetramitiformis]
MDNMPSLLWGFFVVPVCFLILLSSLTVIVNVPPPVRQLTPLTGIKVTLSIAVVIFHCAQLLNYNVQDNPASVLSTHPWLTNIPADVYFLISGLLGTRTVLREISSDKSFSVVTKIFSRAARLAPTILVCGFLFAFMDGSVTSLFSGETSPTIRRSLQHMSSVAVDLQAHALLVPLIWTLRHFEAPLKSSLSLLLFAIPAASFYLVSQEDPEACSAVVSPYPVALACGVSNEDKVFFNAYLENPFEPQCVHGLPTSSNSCAEWLYALQHCTAPFLLGAIVAALLDEAEKDDVDRRTFPHCLSLGQLHLASVVMIVPVALTLCSNDRASIPVQMYETAGFTVTLMIGIAVFMYRTLLPRDHPVHCSGLADIFGHDWWYTFDQLSYEVNALHFWLAMRLILGSEEMMIEKQASASLVLKTSFKVYLFTLLVASVTYVVSTNLKSSMRGLVEFIRHPSGRQHTSKDL